MNKYLEKIALMSDESKQAVKTFAESTAVSLPLSLAGAAAGIAVSRRFKNPILGKKFGSKYDNVAVGGFLGSHIVGGAGELAALNHGFKSHSKNLKEKK
jgi:hypothetical protein